MTKVSTIENEKFNTAFAAYLAGVNAKVVEGYKKYASLTPPEVTYEEGGRYVRVIKVEKNASGVVGSRSVHTFVDKTNGNVLKAAGYRKPETKNPRGNIYDADNGLSGVTEYGAVYLRG